MTADEHEDDVDGDPGEEDLPLPGRGPSVQPILLPLFQHGSTAALLQDQEPSGSWSRVRCPLIDECLSMVESFSGSNYLLTEILGRRERSCRVV